jgi:hypothetical protein
MGSDPCRGLRRRDEMTVFRYLQIVTQPDEHDPVTDRSTTAPSLQLPRSAQQFHSARAKHAAAALGPLLREVSGFDSSDGEIDAAVELCRTLIDLDPDGRGIPTRRLFEHLSGRFPRGLLERRLRVLMMGGAIVKRSDRLYEQDVRLGLSGWLAIALIPWISSMSGHRALLEMMTRTEARAKAPGATAADVRADLNDLARMLLAYANGLRQIIDDRDVKAMMEHATGTDDEQVRSRVRETSNAVQRNFESRLDDALRDLETAASRYVRQQVRLLQALKMVRGIAGLWIRSDEVHEVLKRASLDDLAALWDGIAFDESPYWLDPASVMKAVSDLTSAREEELVPEPSGGGGELSELSFEDTLRALAEQLLEGRDETDLTEFLLGRPWPSPAVALMQLSALAGLELGYDLAYEDLVAIRDEGMRARLATKVVLRRVPSLASGIAAGRDAV